MNFVIVPPIKETYEKDIRTLFPDAALFWLEELDEEKRKKALEKADAFAQTEAYSELFMELATNTDSAIKFCNGIMPKTVTEKIENKEPSIEN